MYDSSRSGKFIAESKFHNVLMSNKRKSRHASERRGKDTYGCSSKGCQPHSSVTVDLRRDKGDSTWQDKLYRT